MGVSQFCDKAKSLPKRGMLRRQRVRIILIRIKDARDRRRDTKTGQGLKGAKAKRRRGTGEIPAARSDR
jgi:hypothetical protein